MAPKTECLSPSELADAVLAALPDDRKQHVDGCRTCRGNVELLRRIDRTSVDSVAELADEVDALVAELLARPRDQWPRAARQAQYQHPFVVRRLLALADDASFRDKKLAVALVTTATRILPALERTSLANDLRFDTWKLASAILREAGNMRAAEVALAQAEIAASDASDSVRARASALFSRALYYAEPDVWRPDEAAALLDEIEPVFRADEERREAVRTARAFLLFRSGNFAAARELFEGILGATPPTARAAYLNALSNVVSARVELDDISKEVEHHIDELIRENIGLGRPVQVARGRWLMGRVHRRRGQFGQSAESLERAMDDIGDADSAIRIGLDVLETLLMAEENDRALSLARALAAEAIALDQREPTRRRSLTAEVFAYAREAAQRGALTADLVSELSRYVDRITRQRPTSFVPPMPLTDM